MLIYFGLFAFIFLVTLNGGLSPFNNYPGTDSSIFIYIAQLMQDGMVPYVDVFDHKGLLLYFINYWGLSIGGYKGIWFLEILFLFLSIVFSYMTIKNLTQNSLLSFFATICSYSILFIYYDGGNLTEQYALPFLSLSLFFILKFFSYSYKTFKHYQVILIGFSFAAVFMLRPNMVALWILFIPAIIILLISKKQYPILMSYLMFFGIGMLIIFIPSIYYLITKSALYEFFDQYFTFNFMYTSIKSDSDIKNKISSILSFAKTPLFILSAVTYYLMLFVNEKKQGALQF